MHCLGFGQNMADPCLYWAWTDNGLVLLLSYIVVMIFMGKDGAVHERFMDMDCEDVRELKEYIRSKIVIDRNA